MFRLQMRTREASRARRASTLLQQPLVKMAAAVLVATGLARSLYYLRDAPSRGTETPLVAELASTIGNRRFIEPRLTGGFEHGRLIPLRSSDAPRLDAQPPVVLAAVARIRERAEVDTSPEVLSALGVTYLVSGEVGAAVKALESATAQAPENAHLWSDLAAAYLVRAKQVDEPADIPTALEAAERAVALPDAPQEAWFNRALALEGLYLTDAAWRAWEDYLDRTAASGWADEARQHLETLPKPRQSSADVDTARVRAALEEGPAAVNRLADEAPHLLREYLAAELLPAWGEEHLVGNPDEEVHREHARLIGNVLLRTTGDAMGQDTARALAEPARTAGSSDPMRSQAQGFLAFRDATRLYDLWGPSCPQFREAARNLEMGGSPFAASARLHAVIACALHASQRSEGQAELGRLQSIAETRKYTHLLGQVRRIQGEFYFNSDVTAALERKRSALALFETTRDPFGEARTLASLAETLTALGENRGAWRERVRALALLPWVEPSRGHAILSDAIDGCLQARAPRCALHFATAHVQASFASSPPAAIGDALIQRASIHDALDAVDAAMADVLESRRWIARTSDKLLMELLTAEANAVEGAILTRKQPEKAIGPLGDAIGYFRVAVKPMRLPPLHLLLARAELARGFRSAAEGELLAGIQVMEAQRVSFRDAGLQASFFEQALPLFDDMVRYQITRHHNPVVALSFVERCRARQLVDSLMGAKPASMDTESAGAAIVSPLDPETLRWAVPDGLALVYYVSLDDALYAWTLTRDGIHFVERSLSSTSLSRLISAHRVALEERAPPEVVQRTGARLHDELVRPLMPFLVSERALVFVPDGVLQSVAFASLWDRATERYLLEDYLVGLAPSGTVFARASTSAAKSTRGSPSRALIVGNPRFDRRLSAGLPDLPEAEAEAAAITKLYAYSQLLTGKEATKGAFLEGVRSSQVVHYAGHAVSTSSSSSTSRLLLAPDTRTGDSGALFLHELDHLWFPSTNVVVLAACRTATGTVSRVEGALSLGRPFLAAGVPDVVASLWDIDDAVSSRFFVAFHRALRQEGDPLPALRTTQIAFLRDRDPVMAHPATWAAFVCMGGLNLHSWSKGQVSSGYGQPDGPATPAGP